jgi:hypothetical protein
LWGSQFFLRSQAITNIRDLQAITMRLRRFGGADCDTPIFLLLAAEASACFRVGTLSFLWLSSPAAFLPRPRVA